MTPAPYSRAVASSPYLERRHEQRKVWIGLALARHDTPREQILAVFEALHERLSMPESRGCAFINAGGEAPYAGAVEDTAEKYRGWIRDLFAHLAAEAGAANPETLGVQLQLLYDGAAISARMDKRPQAAVAARDAAAVLLDAALR
jgi:hypothetical protein